MDEILDRRRDEEPEENPAERRRAIDREIVKFVLVFLGILTLSYGAYIKFRDSEQMERYLEIVAIPVVWCVKPISESVFRDGTYVAYNEWGMRIVPDCSAIPSMSIFTAAVIAFPALWRKRLLGLLLGIPFLFVVNVLRLACLLVVGQNEEFLERTLGISNMFNIAHVYIWQAVFIIFVIGIWLFWVKNLVETPSRGSSGPP